MELPYISLPNEITNEEYHRGERFKSFISSTTLKQISVSPKWLKYCQDNMTDDRMTAEWKLDGSCYHAILSSLANTGDMTEFNNMSVVYAPPVNPKNDKVYGYETKTFIEAFQSVVDVNPGKEIYSEKEFNHNELMIKELRKGSKHLSPMINSILKIGKAEVSCFVDHRSNDLVQSDKGRFKIRYDIITNNKIVDWKGCKAGDHKTDAFDKVIGKMQYDFSAAFYQYFRWMITGKWTPFYWVAQEKEPPFDFNIISANEWAFNVQGGKMIGLGAGAERFIKSLEAYLYCLENEEWPGVSVFTKPDYRGQRIAHAKVPGYMKTKEVDFYH